MIRGAVSLPNGLGKDVRVVVFCKPEKEAEAKELALMSPVPMNWSRKFRAVGSISTRLLPHRT